MMTITMVMNAMLLAKIFHIILEFLVADLTKYFLTGKTLQFTNEVGTADVWDCKHNFMDFKLKEARK